jgi:hypothetical protein
MTNPPDNAGLKALAEAARMRAEPCTPAYSVKVKAFSAFQAAASPDRILALIARNEALEGALRSILRSRITWTTKPTADDLTDLLADIHQAARTALPAENPDD